MIIFAPIARLAVFATVLIGQHSTFADNAATMDSNRQANRLIDAQSPYLQQHAYNPVDWHQWGDEAFAKAKAENKPVLVSIGYSTCHWCHVMNRESFSDPDVSSYLNKNYICIKVDREERPDVDRVYMTFVQSMTGHGGWPLNAWLTPDRKPFYGGTYFPPTSNRGTPSFMETLTRIHELWTKDDGKTLIAQSEKAVAYLNETLAPKETAETTYSIDLIKKAVDTFENAFDSQNAGFGRAPKFPTASNLSFLLGAATNPKLEPTRRDAALNMATATLDKMALSGMRDQIGGGFHRYAVDDGWTLPHFEKMLYDQSLINSAYIDAWLVSKSGHYENVIVTSLDYLLRDMRHPDGGFYSAEDAESPEPGQLDAKREGAFYVWTWDEMGTLFPDEATANFARTLYAMEKDGNAPTGPYHTIELDGYNTLRLAKSVGSIAQQFDISEQDATTKIAAIQTTLFEHSRQRPRPHLDDKIITAWNGLAISTLARAAQHLERSDYLRAAEQTARFIKSRLFEPESGKLIRLYRGKASHVSGFSEDYAFLINGLLDLYEASSDTAWLEWAKTLQDTQIRLFFDKTSGGFFANEINPEIILARSKEDYDGGAGTPTDSSVSVKNLARLAQIFDDQEYEKKAEQTMAYFAPVIDQSPHRLPAMLDSMSYLLNKPMQIVIAGDPKSKDTRALLKAVNQRFIPNRVLLYADGQAGQTFLAKNLEFVEAMDTIDGKATAYVCENYVCQEPTNTLASLNQQLDTILGK